MQKCNLCRKDVRRLAKGFVQCSNCKTIHFLEAHSPPYEEDYFGKEYKQQYGKTYREDEKHIRKKMRERIARLQQSCSLKNIPTASLRILEVGSAGGFFLDEARAHWPAAFLQGWEISENMSCLARARGHDVRCGDYFDLYRQWKLEKQEAFDLLFAFYTVEHFDDQNAFWYSAARLVKNDGYLVLALPSYRGPMYHLHKKQWFNTHPQDHFADYSPFALTVACKNFSFTTLRVFADAVHPERLLPWNGKATPLFIKKIIAKFQEKFLFADTMLAILRKSE